MMLPQDLKGICRLLAKIVDYPGPDWKTLADACVREHRCDGLRGTLPGMVGPLHSLATYARGQSTGACEELYTQTFDTTPATTLYLGHHLFGDGAKRSAFMVKLEEAYQEHAFSHGSELPDHLCVVLRFLAVCRDAGFAVPLVQECLLPASEKIETALRDDHNPYHHALVALRVLSRQMLAEASKGRVSA